MASRHQIQHPPRPESGRPHENLATCSAALRHAWLWPGTKPAKPLKAAAAKTPDAAAVKKHMTPAQLALSDPTVNSIGMRLVPIPAGQFQSQHLVKITKPFFFWARTR
jgi:hypothetical protein